MKKKQSDSRPPLSKAIKDNPIVDGVSPAPPEPTADYIKKLTDTLKRAGKKFQFKKPETIHEKARDRTYKTEKLYLYQRAGVQVIQTQSGVLGMYFEVLKPLRQSDQGTYQHTASLKMMLDECAKYLQANKASMDKLMQMSLPDNRTYILIRKNYPFLLEKDIPTQARAVAEFVDITRSIRTIMGTVFHTADAEHTRILNDEHMKVFMFSPLVLPTTTPTEE